MRIRIFYDGIKFRLKETHRIKEFICKVISDENKKPGDLIFIFTGDVRIKEINQEFLGHDYYTDVISFDYHQGEFINGEIYISIDTVRNNSLIYKSGIFEEVMRVMIHGTLHLLGFRDDSEEEKGKMIERQEELLTRFMEEV